jgi:hypothetical protein
MPGENGDNAAAVVVFKLKRNPLYHPVSEQLPPGPDA